MRTRFDPKTQHALLAMMHQTMVDDALMLWVVHDVNLHVLSPKAARARLAAGGAGCRPPGVACHLNAPLSGHSGALEHAA